MNAQHNKNNQDNNKKPHSKRKKPFNRSSKNSNRRPKSLTPAKIIQKYDNLLEQHITARRKYYELHARVKGKQLDKIEKNMDRTLNDLRRFEATLKDWQREILKEKIDQYPPDRDHSSNNNMEPIGEEVSFVGDFEDPHLLETQKQSDFKDDTEESIGSMEDYYKLKGVDPPVEKHIKEK